MELHTQLCTIVARHEGKEESEEEAEVGRICHQHQRHLLMQQFPNGLLPPPGFLQQLQRGGHELQPGPEQQPPQAQYGQEEQQGRVEEEDKDTDAALPSCLSAVERQVLASFSAAAAAALPKPPSSSPGPYDDIWKSTMTAGSRSVGGIQYNGSGAF